MGAAVRHFNVWRGRTFKRISRFVAVFGGMAIGDRSHGNRVRESQRDSGLQPRVATQKLPWVMDRRLTPTPTGLKIVAHGFPG